MSTFEGYDKLCTKVSEMRGECSKIFKNWFLVEQAVLKSHLMDSKKVPILYSYLSTLDNLLKERNDGVEKIMDKTKEAIFNDKISEQVKKGISGVSTGQINTMNESTLKQGDNIIKNIDKVLHM